MVIIATMGYFAFLMVYSPLVLKLCLPILNRRDGRHDKDLAQAFLQRFRVAGDSRQQLFGLLGCHALPGRRNLAGLLIGLAFLRLALVCLVLLAWFLILILLLLASLRLVLLFFIFLAFAILRLVFLTVLLILFLLLAILGLVLLLFVFLAFAAFGLLLVLLLFLLLFLRLYFDFEVLEEPDF